MDRNIRKERTIVTIEKYNSHQQAGDIGMLRGHTYIYVLRNTILGKGARQDVMVRYIKRKGLSQRYVTHTNFKLLITILFEFVHEFLKLSALSSNKLV